MDELRKLRETLGLTQQQMADKLDFSLSYYIKLENNKRNLSGEFLERLKLKFPFVDINNFFNTNNTNSVTNKEG